MEIKERNQSIDLVKIIAMMGVMALHTCLGRTDNLPGFVLSRTFGLRLTPLALEVDFVGS